MGRKAAAATRPVHRAWPVSSVTSTPTATVCIHEPMLETSAALQTRAKSRWRSGRSDASRQPPAPAAGRRAPAPSGLGRLVPGLQPVVVVEVDDAVEVVEGGDQVEVVAQRALGRPAPRRPCASDRAAANRPVSGDTIRSKPRSCSSAGREQRRLARPRSCWPPGPRRAWPSATASISSIDSGASTKMASTPRSAAIRARSMASSRPTADAGVGAGHHEQLSSGGRRRPAAWPASPPGARPACPPCARTSWATPGPRGRCRRRRPPRTARRCGWC